MSKTIDERVVSMQFDNKQFENNVKTSMSTLEKLKRSLNLKGASKGLENVNAAAKSCNLSPLSKAADTVKIKFSAMEVMAVTALANITNSAVNAGKRIVSALTIDPIMSGFQEYETQINAIQTILANTQSKGTTLDDVNSALDTLNKYADKTIYNFTQMTRNIGTFTAAGIDLETSVNAIQGIANLAAISGSNSQQASTAMYQLSQALASGTVKLMDWNSVVNAGMGGQVFQDALKETARVHGIAIDKMIKKEGSFRETLSNGWLSSEILTETLQKFTLTTEGLTEAQIEQNRQMLKAKGYTDVQIEEIFKLGETATNAATKVKTFTQLFDTLKEAAQSGWTQSWELIIGDFDQAKELLTNASDEIGELINNSAESRNKVLSGALASKWSNLTDKINEAGATSEDFQEAVTKVAKDQGKDLDDLIKKYGSLEKVFKSGELSAKDLKTALSNLTTSSNDLDLVKRVLKNGMEGDDVKQIETALKKLGYTLTGGDGVDYSADGYYGTLTRDAIKAFQKDKGLEATGIVDEKTLSALKEATKSTVKFEESLDDLIDGVTELGGREKIIQSFANIWKGLKKVGSAVSKAWKETIYGATDEDAITQIKIDKLSKLIDGFHNFSKILAGDGDAAENFGRALKGVFAILKIVSAVLSGGLKAGLKFLSKVFGITADNALEFAANMGDSIVAFKDWLFEGNKIAQWFDNLAENIGVGIRAIRDWLNAFLQTSEVQEKISGIRTEFSKLIKTLSGRFSGGLTKFKEFIDRIKTMDSFSIANIVKAFKDFKDNVLGFFIQKDKGTIFDGLIKSVKNLGNVAKKYLESIGLNFEKAGEKIGIFLKTIKDFLSDNFGTITALATLVGLFLVFKKIANAVTSLAEAFTKFAQIGANVGKNINALLTSISNSIKLSAKASAMKNIAISIAILAGSLAVLALLPTDKLLHATGAIAVMAVVLSGALIVLSKVSDKLGDLAKLSASILTLSASLLVFAIAAKIVSGIDDSGLGKCALVIGGFIALIALMSKSVKAIGTGGMAKFSSMMTGLSSALLLMSLAVIILGKMKTSTLIQGGSAVAAFLLMMSGMMKATNHLAKDMPKFAGMMAGLSASLLIMAIAVGILGKMKIETLLKGGAAIGAFLLMMRGIMKTTKYLDKGMPKFAAIMFGLSTGLLAMAFTAKIIGGIDTKTLVKGGVVISAFLLMFVQMMKATKYLTKNSANSAKIGAMLLSFAASMLILTGVITILSFIKLKALAKAVAAIGVVGLIFAGMVALTKYAKGSKGVKSTIITMSAAVGILAISLAALSFIEPSKLAGAAAALSVVMGMFALLAASTKFIGAKTIGTLIAMAGVVTILGGIMYLLAGLPADSTWAVAKGLSVLITSLSASCLLLAAVGSVGPAAFIGIGVLAALLGVITLFAGIAIASLPAIGSQLSKFMANVQPFLNGAKQITPDMANGLKTLAEAFAVFMGIGLVNAITFGAPLKSLGGQLKSFGKALADFSDAVSDTTFDSDKIKAAGEAAQALAGVSVTLASGTTFIDWLTGQGDLSTFGKTLTDFGKGLGEFSGAVSEEKFDTEKIKSAAEAAQTLVGVSVTLASGTSFIDWLTGAGDLSKFGGTLRQFGEGLCEFSSSVSDKEFNTGKIKAAAEAAQILAGVSISLAEGKSFIDWLTKAGDLDVFGAQLKLFGDGLTEFNSSVTDKEFDTKKIKAAAEAGQTLAGVSVTLSEGVSFIDWLCGTDNLSIFGSRLKEFGSGLSVFNTVASGKEFNSGKIKSAAEAAQALAGVSVTLSEGVSFIDWLTGVSNLDNFGSSLYKFGSGLSSFNSAIGNKTFDTGKIKAAAEAAQALAGVSVTLSEGVSFIDWLTGASNLDNFGSSLYKFGSGLVSFNDKVGGTTFDTDKIKSAAEAAQALAGVSVTLSEGTSFFDWLTGAGDLSKFGGTLQQFGEGLANFNNAVSGKDIDFDSDKIEAATKAAQELANMAGIVGENSAGWDWLTGKDGLDVFGEKVAAFGDSLAAFSSSVSGEDFDVSSVTDAVGQIKEIINVSSGLTEEGVNNLSSFSGKLKTLGKNLSSFGSNVENVDDSKFSKIAKGLKDLASIKVNNADAISSFINSLGKVSTNGINSFVRSFSQSAPKVISAVASMLSRATVAVRLGGVKLSAAFKTIISAAITSAASVCGGFVNVGFQAAAGFAMGISSGSFLAKMQAASMARAALSSAKKSLGIASPSKEFYAIGDYAGQGFTNALSDYENKTYKAGASIAESAKTGLSNAISRIRETIENGVDSQPTIRPVLDLSDVETGIGTIDNMFGLNPSVATLSRVGAISSMMNNQNGANDDVISAIKDLGRKLGNSSGDTYTISGITYDDGSNITDAVKTLVRAAKVERRI